MKHLVTSIILIPLYIILSSSTNNLPENNKVVEELEKQERLILLEKIEWLIYYEATIEFIKKHEGFAGGKAYYCAAGVKTIGYGHVIKKGEIFTNDRISKENADLLLRKDFNKALELVDKFTSLKKSNQRLAIAHFIFAKGIGNFLKSTIRKKIENNEPISNELLKWCVYRKPDGTVVRSDYSLNIRIWEVEMYNK